MSDLIIENEIEEQEQEIEQEQEQEEIQNKEIEQELEKEDNKRVYISIKKDILTKSTLLCQINDPQLHLIGDIGAIGRLTTDETEKKIIIDLKGRQYGGQLYPGPTVMFLNISQSTSKSQLNNEIKTMKVESITNEFCPLVFEKDLLADLKGNFSGEGIESLKDDESENNDENNNEKSNGNGNDDSDSDNNINGKNKKKKQNKTKKN